MESSSQPEIIPPKTSNLIPSLEIQTGESCWTQFLDQVENEPFCFYFQKKQVEEEGNNEEIDDLLYEQLIWEENVKQVQILSIEDQEVEYNEDKHI